VSIVNTKPGVYHIAFDTDSTPGYLRAVKITIECDMLPDDSKMPAPLQERFNVALVDHPLYAALKRYVLANNK
jgi:hypothetical protein